MRARRGTATEWAPSSYSPSPQPSPAGRESKKATVRPERRPKGRSRRTAALRLRCATLSTNGLYASIIGEVFEMENRHILAGERFVHDLAVV
jgi:hypothetical protein